MVLTADKITGIASIARTATSLGFAYYQGNNGVLNRAN